MDRSLADKNQMRNIIIGFFSILISINVFSSQSFAKEKSEPWDKFNISAGGFLTAFNSNIRFGSKALGLGTIIDAEDALGLDSSSIVYRIDTMYRFGQSGRHRVMFSYYDFRRDSKRVLESDIQIGDRVYRAGTTLSSRFDMRIFKSSYSYSFFQDDRFNLGVSVGLYVTPIDLEFKSPDFKGTDEELTAPLPVFGFKSEFAITPKIFLKQNVEVFYLEVGDFKGSILDFLMAVEYYAWEHVAFGVGFDLFRFNLEADGEDYPTLDFVGSIEYDYSGMLVYVKYYL